MIQLYPFHVRLILTYWAMVVGIFALCCAWVVHEVGWKWLEIVMATSALTSLLMVVFTVYCMYQVTVVSDDTEHFNRWLATCLLAILIPLILLQLVINVLV